MGMGFYELSEERMSGATFSDNRFCIPRYSVNDLVIDMPGSDGIDGITIDGDDSDAPVEYYDLQGRRVDNPSAGLYIRRQGRHSSKVFVK